MGLISLKNLVLPERGTMTSGETPLEKVLVNLLSSELGCAVKALDHFTDLGGNSLHATRLLARLFDAYGVLLPNDLFLTCTSVREVAVNIEDKVIDLVGRLSQSAIDNIWEKAWDKGIVIAKDPHFMVRHPKVSLELAGPVQVALNGALGEQRSQVPKRICSYRGRLNTVQKHIWKQAAKNPDDPNLNMSFYYTIRGTVDAGILESALRKMIRTHEILRTAFIKEDNQPRQAILPVASFSLGRESFVHLFQEDRDPQVKAWMEKKKKEPFTLRKPPLFRGYLIEMDQNRHILFIVAHRLVFDEWSPGTFSKELGTAYQIALSGNKVNGQPLFVQFADLAEWEARRQLTVDLDYSLSYWQDKLAPPHQALALPADVPGDQISSCNAATLSFTVPPGLTDSLKAFAKQECVTLSTVFLAAYKSWLCLQAGAHDVCVGVEADCRQVPGTERLLGPVIFTIPIRTELKGKLTFIDVVRKVGETIEDALEHVDVPLSDIAAAVRPEDGDASQLLQSRFSFRKESPRLLLGKGISVREYVDLGLMDSDVQLELVDASEGIIGTFKYKSDRFRRTRIEEFADRFLALLEHVARQPEKIVEIPSSRITLVS